MQENRATLFCKSLNLDRNKAQRDPYAPNPPPHAASHSIFSIYLLFLFSLIRRFASKTEESANRLVFFLGFFNLTFRSRISFEHSINSFTLPPSFGLSAMASLTPISQSQSLFNKNQFKLPPILSSDFFPKKFSVSFLRMNSGVPTNAAAAAAGVVSATTAEKAKKRYPGEAKGFVEEMRFVAMKLHTRDQAKEGEKEVKEPQEGPVAKWEPTVDGYLKFLVDSKLVYDTLEGIVEKAPFPFYAEFRNTGLERSEKLARDLEWFKEQGYAIPEPSAPGVTYAEYLKELSERDPQAFICHFYNIYFAHSAGGRMIGKKVAEMILDKKELEFYKWDGELPQLLQNVREKLNKVAESWTREEKNHCLEETEKSFKHSGEILRLILS